MSRLGAVALAALKYEASRTLLGLDVWASELGEPSEDILPVVRAASGLVAGERTGNGDPNTPSGGFLRSIFDSISLDGREQTGERRVYAPVEYGVGGPASHFPRLEMELSNDHTAERLAQGLRQLADTNDPDAALNMLERYGSYLPSPGSQEDVSLFDHARATAAVAVCMEGHRNETGVGDLEDSETRRYLYVRGDLSGVQKFLYTITSKGALRMLRARSFYLELIAEHAVAELLQAAGVPRTNVVYVGGGGFQLLLPNTEASGQAIREVRDGLNATFADGFGRELYLAMEAVGCGASGITGAGLTETTRELARTVSERKAQRFKEDLTELLAETRDPNPESCEVCTRDNDPIRLYNPKDYKPYHESAEVEAVATEEPVAMCGTCRMLALASLGFLRNEYLVTDGEDFTIGDAGYGLSNTADNDAYALRGVGDEECLRGVVPLPAARHAARDEEDEKQIADFNQLARRSAGADLVAVLRMDVDDLGRIFGSGIPAEKRTFARYAALSRSFTSFFKVMLPQICEGRYEESLWLFEKRKSKTEGEADKTGDARDNDSDETDEQASRAVTVVYSGGDDLFVVGSWGDVLELAVDVRQAFGEFVGHNPAVTLSGGISLHKPGEPLYLMAEQAGAAEEEAKAHAGTGKRAGRKKDSVVLFYRGPEDQKAKSTVPRALFWDEVESGVVEVLKKINTFRDEKSGELPFPRRFTRLLLDVTDVYERDGHFSLPMLAYALARMRETAQLGDDPRWRDLEKQLLEIETIGRHLRPAATWLDLAEREEDRDRP